MGCRLYFGRDALPRVRWRIRSTLQPLQTPQRAHGPAAAEPYLLGVLPKLNRTMSFEHSNSDLEAEELIEYPSMHSKKHETISPCADSNGIRRL